MLDPAELEVTARGLPEAQAAQVQAYLDGLSERQRRELSGVRDRLAILAESEIHPWLEPTPDTDALDIHKAVQERAVTGWAVVVTPGAERAPGVVLVNCPG